jgi:hypothetical protein
LAPPSPADTAQPPPALLHSVDQTAAVTPAVSDLTKEPLDPTGASHDYPAAGGGDLHIYESPPVRSLADRTSGFSIAPPPTASRLDEENWSAAKAGMWDSLVSMAEGLSNQWRNTAVSTFLPGLGSYLAPKLPNFSLDWAKFGPPAPTGNPARDAELVDNYRSGGWVTTTVSLAAPIGGEGLLNSARSAATKLPELYGAGIGGGQWVGFAEQWLGAFGETSEALGLEVPTTLGPEMDNALAPGELAGPGGVLDDYSVGNMNEEAAAYQEKAGGLPSGKGYYVAGPDGIPIQFDGYVDNKLIEAKYYMDNGSFTRGANEFMNNPNSEFAQKWYDRAMSDLKQAEKQVAAAGNVQIEWRVSGEQAAKLLQQMFDHLPINVVHFP